VSQSRGSLHVTNGGSVALLTASSWTLLGAATIPGLVTAGDALADFDVPAAGRLRYTGTLTRTFGVRASMTVAGPGAIPVSFSFRIAKNGVTSVPSEQTRSLWSFPGLQGVTLDALLTLAPNDFVEVYAAVSADATLELYELALVAVAAELVGSEVIPGPPAGGDRWQVYEDLLERHLSAGPLAETVTFTSASAAAEDVSGIFSLNTMEIVAGDVKVSTYSPHVGLRVADLPAYPQVGDTIRARGIDYLVAEGGVLVYGGGGWVELMLEADF
jgi:hypothetical protein